MNKLYKDRNNNANGLPESRFTIPAIVFPRWFFSTNTKHLFKPYEEWLEIWTQKGCNQGKDIYFAPPRDPNTPTSRKHPDWDHLPEGRNQIYALLEQVSMVLICPNGHISDIPWDKFFNAKVNNEKHLFDEGFDLFHYDVPCPCSSGHTHHELQWLENRSHAESFGLLKCRNCGQTASLEGIMNLQPLCSGEKPWEGVGVHAHTACMQGHVRTNMKWAMVTSNSVYYAENFSSLFIPDCYGVNKALDLKLQRLLKLMDETWYGKIYLRNNPGATKEDYMSSENLNHLIDKAMDSNIEVTEDEMQKVINAFLPQQEEDNANIDVRENYRFQEFSVFNGNSHSLTNSDKLSFVDIELPSELQPFFHKIQQVETLGVTSTQINFSRVSMPQPKTVNGHIEYPDSMKIFRESPENVLVMPANQTFGEGLFFSFNEDELTKWLNKHKEILNDRYSSDENHDPIYNSQFEKMERGGLAKFYLLHTFSHVILKELEFSCGYPTASMKERLYFSERMCGVLIYTADGSEGSMGGLVWQGQPQLIKKIIISAMQRATNCPSDPICWENEDQLNHAACFSCAMVSETSCEERNLGLDRRALIDDDFGYFKDLLKF
jgi:hypothetical protein